MHACVLLLRRAGPTILELHPDISHLLPGMSLTLRVRRTNSTSETPDTALGSSGNKAYVRINNPLYQAEADAVRHGPPAATAERIKPDSSAAAGHSAVEEAQLLQALQLQGLVLPGATLAGPSSALPARAAPCANAALAASYRSGPGHAAAPHLSAESSESIQRAAMAAAEAATSAVSHALAALWNRSASGGGGAGTSHAPPLVPVPLGLSIADAVSELSFAPLEPPPEQAALWLDDCSAGSTAAAYVTMDSAAGAARDSMEADAKPVRGSGSAFRATSLQSLLQAVGSGNMSSVELLAALSQGVPLTAILRGQPVVGSGAGQT